MEKFNSTLSLIDSYFDVTIETPKYQLLKQQKKIFTMICATKCLNLLWCKDKIYEGKHRCQSYKIINQRLVILSHNLSLGCLSQTIWGSVYLHFAGDVIVVVIIIIFL